MWKSPKTLTETMFSPEDQHIIFQEDDIENINNGVNIEEVPTGVAIEYITKDGKNVENK